MGNTYTDSKGYKRWSNSDGLVHRTVSRPSSGQVVHHRDGDKSNFRSSNLVNMSRSAHSKLHARKSSSFW